MWERSGDGPMGPIEPRGPGCPGGPGIPGNPGLPFGPGEPVNKEDSINQMNLKPNITLMVSPSSAFEGLLVIQT